MGMRVQTEEHGGHGESRPSEGTQERAALPGVYWLGRTRGIVRASNCPECISTLWPGC